MNDNSKVNEPLNNNSDSAMDNGSNNADIVSINNSDSTTGSNSREERIKRGTNNLKPYNLANRTTEEQQRIARLGGIKSGESRKRRKEAREYLEKILTTDIPVQNVDEILGEAKILCNEDYSAYNVLWVKLLQLGLSGSEKAIMLLRDTIGDKPIEKTSIDANIITDEDRKQLDKLRKELASITKIG